MAAAIGMQMIGQMVSGLLQQGMQGQQGMQSQQNNGNINSYRQGMHDGADFEKMFGQHGQGGDRNININFNPRDRISF